MQGAGAVRAGGEQQLGIADRDHHHAFARTECERADHFQRRVAGAGEPLDVFVNGTLIAQGEVVVVNDRFGVRLTDVVSPAERIKRLR